AGRWEVEGAMWVEADCNIPSGESLVRQLLYGKKFFKDEFGVDCRVLWLPDVFGYSAALPQILKKSGVDWFVTSKISWNETNRMPSDLFNWKGIDGTSIPTYFLTAQDRKRDGSTGNYTTYNAILCPKQVAGAYERFNPKELSDEVMITYGYGDGGGGPTEGMIERGRRMTGGLPECPKVKFEFAGEFLSDVEKKTAGKKMPEWSGELYLEYHRGTYTSQADNKKNNRKSEFLYRDAEALSVLGEKLLGIPYPQKKLLDGWEKILLCQFHDVLPGSSIHEVYEDTKVIYEDITKIGASVADNVRDAVVKNVKTDGGLLVFNPNSFDASAEVMADGEWRYVENVPAMGWAVVAPAEKKVPKVSERKIENDLLSVEFDENMNISRIYDKTEHREVLKSGEVGNAIEAYEDYPRAYDAWEITNYYKEKKFAVNDVILCEKYVSGEKAGFAVTRKFRNSVIKQTVTLDGHTKNIAFDTELDWKEDHVLLKAAFPINVNANTALYDIQYGCIERPTHENTSWDAAKFEVCAHKYADISERGYGVSLINDCKYGYSASGSTLSLTLLKCATYPDPEADKHYHKFTYVLYPHAGDISAAKTPENAYIVNDPLKCVTLTRQDGNLPERFSLVKTDKEGTFVEAVKKAENGDGVIVRIYDAINSRGPRTLTFGIKPKEAYVCDMLEKEGERVKIDGNDIVVDVAPFEIKTLKVKF
ncbi:MAG: alpha-mannosidase, partial [Clostridia bacterium]|nr:alpha-mannosidase [Clostridia bacterium]